MNSQTDPRKAALILGANSDIATALAVELGSEGYDLMLAGRDPAALEPQRKILADRFRAIVSVHPFDVLDTDMHLGFFTALKPVPDVVVCAVGLLPDQDRAARSPTLATQTMMTNYVGPALALEAAATVMVAAGKTGTIVGISSMAGERGRAVNYYYGSAKAGFTQFLSGLRQKLARSGVHVIIVKPGSVATRMTKDMALAPALTATPEATAKRIAAAIRRGEHDVYGWKWFWIATIVRAIPAAIFKRLKF